MSRLDSFIRRLCAQRDILNSIADDVREIPGAIMELGLGNGRTYDHIRELFPDRRIIAFDRVARSFESSTPQSDNLVVGEIKDTIGDYLGVEAALVHADIGTGHENLDALTLTWLPDAVASLLKRGGIAACGLPLEHPELTPMPLPQSVAANRYFLYRRR
ncbi:class I SAM-dependent methyltransferase [Ochrobactrum teleogrylli]|uniref:class I SAM-dependent methyltransferase n=1 Tax=Ochrobactrum teleogrylli TaxID=2479765 RepID=UPI00384EBECA